MGRLAMPGVDTCLTLGKQQRQGAEGWVWSIKVLARREVELIATSPVISRLCHPRVPPVTFVSSTSSTNSSLFMDYAVYALMPGLYVSSLDTEEPLRP